MVKKNTLAYTKKEFDYSNIIESNYMNKIGISKASLITTKGKLSISIKKIKKLLNENKQQKYK